MNEPTVLIIEQSEVVGTILSNQLNDVPCHCSIMNDITSFDLFIRTQPVALILLDVMVTARDQAGYERPFWQLLMQHPGLTTPVICFSGTNSTPGDTPLFSAPTETLIIGSVEGFAVIADIVRAYLHLFARHPLLHDAIYGTYLPSLRGEFTEIPLASLMKMFALGQSTGVLIVREGMRVGILACEHGQAVHALAGAASGEMAFHAIINWTHARFAFFHNIVLGERTINHELENLLLEASRRDDEVADMAASLPANGYVRRIRGFTDQLQGRSINPHEWQLLILIDRYHHIQELIAHSNLGTSVAMQALRSLKRQKLIEILSTNAFESVTQ